MSGDSEPDTIVHRAAGDDAATNAGARRATRHCHKFGTPAANMLVQSRHAAEAMQAATRALLRAGATQLPGGEFLLPCAATAGPAAPFPGDVRRVDWAELNRTCVDEAALQAVDRACRAVRAEIAAALRRRLDQDVLRHVWGATVR